MYTLFFACADLLYNSESDSGLYSKQTKGRLTRDGRIQLFNSHQISDRFHQQVNAFHNENYRAMYTLFFACADLLYNSESDSGLYSKQTKGRLTRDGRIQLFNSHQISDRFHYVNAFHNKILFDIFHSGGYITRVYWR